MKKINVLAMVMLVVLFGCATAPEHDLAQQSDVPHTTVSEQETPSETATPAPQVEEQVTITMWAMDASDSMCQLLDDFNNENNGCQIEVTYFQVSAEWCDMADRLENGELPDILFLSMSYMPFYRLVNTARLENLLPYAQEDGITISEDYLRCMSIDGKLYEISPTFMVGCMSPRFAAAKIEKRDFGSIGEILDIESELSGGRTLVAEDIRPSSYLEWLMNCYFDDFVVLDTGECSFDSELFRQMLEFSSKAKTSRQLEELEEPVSQVYFIGPYGSYSTYSVIESGNDRVGFPGDKYYIYAQRTAVMSSDCQHKKEAWSFLKRLLSQEYYDTISGNYFATNAQIDREMWAQTEESDYTRAAKEAISKADRAGRTDTVLLDIILQESLPYFEGQISLDEAVENIQSMASLYIADKWLGQEVTYPPTEVKSVKKLAEAINAAGRTGLPSETRLVDRANELQNIHYFYVPAVEFEGYKLTRISVTPEEIVYHYGDIQVTFYRKEGDFSKKVVYDEEAGTMTAPLEYTRMTISVPPELNDYDYLYSHCQAYITNPSEVILGGPQ